MSPNINQQTQRSHGYDHGHGHGHNWTRFELDIVLSLICKGEHLRWSPIMFTAMINEALNSSTNGSVGENEILVKDVRHMLAYIGAEKKAALAFIERQPGPYVVTRTKKRVFERNIPFTGSKKEWLAGRKDKVALSKQQTNAGRRGIDVARSGRVQAKALAPFHRNQPSFLTDQIDTHNRLHTQSMTVGWIDQDRSTVTTPAWNNHGNSDTTCTSYVHPPTLTPPPATPLHGGWHAPAFPASSGRNINNHWEVKDSNTSSGTVTEDTEAGPNETAAIVSSATRGNGLPTTYHGSHA